MNKKIQPLLNGIWKENPTFVMLIGMCPTIAITTSISNAIGMGACVIFVLFFSNLIISLIRKIVPNEIRIPVFIVVIATLVTICQLLLKAFFPALDASLGEFVALIVVNCIILGRAEAFASKNGPGASMLDGLGMGLGFTLAIAIISLIRQFLSEVCGLAMFSSLIGGFLVLGIVIGIVQSIKIGVRNNKTKKEKEAKMNQKKEQNLVKEAAK